MATRTIVSCDLCKKDRDPSDGLPWLTGVLSTDGGSMPAKQSSGLYCSLKCLHDHIGMYIVEMGLPAPQVIWPDGATPPLVP